MVRVAWNAADAAAAALIWFHFAFRNFFLFLESFASHQRPSVSRSIRNGAFSRFYCGTLDLRVWKTAASGRVGSYHLNQNECSALTGGTGKILNVGCLHFFCRYRHDDAENSFKHINRWTATVAVFRLLGRWTRVSLAGP